MYNSWKNFENICEKVLKIITNNEVKILRNQKLKWPDGLREFDIIYSFEQYWYTYTHFVECKDYNKKVDVIRIWEFVNKCNDFNEKKISRKIFITWKWFSSQALNKAKREWIECWTINEFLSSKNIELTVPVMITEITEIKAHITWTCHIWKKERTLSKNLEFISDVSTNVILENLKDKIMLEGEEKLIFTHKDCWLQEFFLRDVYWEKIEIKNFILKFDIVKNHYLWHLSDIPDAYLIDDKIKTEKRFIINPQEILIKYKDFKLYKDFNDLPEFNNPVRIMLEIRPDLHFYVSPKIDSIQLS